MDDTARLEWLVTGEGKRRAAYVAGSDAKGWAVMDCHSGLTFMSRGCPSFRSALDEAMMKHPTVTHE